MEVFDEQLHNFKNYILEYYEAVKSANSENDAIKLTSVIFGGSGTLKPG